MTNSLARNSYGLYIHIPFCLTKCFYCSFYSVQDLSKINDYFSALITEIELYKYKKYYVDTIYFGGGTPSVVDSSYIRDVINAIYRCFQVVQNPEITIEINPGTVQYNILKDYYLMGINRVNIGIQSISDKTLYFLGRRHNFRKALDTVFLAREIGFDNLGIDLIYGIPGQSLSKWKIEMEKIIAIEPEHISCYLLSLERGTPMGDKFLNNEIISRNDKVLKSMIQFTNKYLNKNGFYRYEVSNYSKKSFNSLELYQSKHNMKYWNFYNYIGFGASAHSFKKKKRWWNHSSIDRYISDIIQKGILPIAGEEELTLEQQINEFIYLGLRQYRGVSIISFKVKFGISIYCFFDKAIKTLCQDGFIYIRDNRIILTNKGFLFLDSIALWFCI